MIKLIFGSLIIIVSTAVGYKFSYKYVKKLKFYDNFLIFLNNYVINLINAKNSARNVRSGNSEFDEFVKNVFDKSFSCGKDINRPDYLTESEYASFSSIIESLGKSDTAGEKMLVNKYVSDVTYLRDNSREISKKYSAMGVKLGLAFGACVFIIII